MMNQESYLKIGKNIKIARIQLEVSQKEMADFIGCSQAAITKIENGKMHGEYFYKYLKVLLDKGIDLNPILAHN